MMISGFLAGFGFPVQFGDLSTDPGSDRNDSDFSALFLNIFARPHASADVVSESKPIVLSFNSDSSGFAVSDAIAAAPLNTAQEIPSLGEPIAIMITADGESVLQNTETESLRMLAASFPHAPEPAGLEAAQHEAVESGPLRHDGKLRLEKLGDEIAQPGHERVGSVEASREHQAVETTQVPAAPVNTPAGALPPPPTAFSIAPGGIDVKALSLVLGAEPSEAAPSMIKAAPGVRYPSPDAKDENIAVDNQASESVPAQDSFSAVVTAFDSAVETIDHEQNGASLELPTRGLPQAPSYARLHGGEEDYAAATENQSFSDISNTKPATRQNGPTPSIERHGSEHDRSSAFNFGGDRHEPSRQALKEQPAAGSTHIHAGFSSVIGNATSARPPGEGPRPVSAASVIEQIAGEISAHIRMNRSQAVLTLDPAELGGLKIGIILQDDKVQAHILAESDESRRLIENHLPELKHALQAQQLELIDVRFDSRLWSHGGGNDPAQNFQQNGHRRQKYPGENERAGLGVGVDEFDQHRAGQRAILQDGRVSMWA